MAINMENQVQLANALLAKLVEYGSLTETTVLLKACGISLTDRFTCLKCLKRLASAGKVNCHGKGKFRWMALVTTWDSARPFTSTAAKTATPATSTEFPSEMQVKGHSYPVRQELKEIGCKWSSEAKAWFAPSHAILMAAQKLVDDAAGVPAVVPATDDAAAKMTADIDNLKKLLNDAIAMITAKDTHIEELKKTEGKVKTLIVKTHEGIKLSKQFDIVLPANYDDIMALAGARKNILLVGPAGCGKTHTAKMVADSLGLKFGSVSCSSGMSEAHLIGRSIPDFHKGRNVFITTEFLECYENGGVFLIDEIDAADPNLLLVLNSAIANGYCNVPSRTDKPQAIKHDDFVLIATANTYGRGATRSYAGRNQLDESTLDRFRIGILECGYSKAVESVLCPNDSLRNRLQGIRAKIENAGLRRIMSTRFIEDAADMLEVGWSEDRIVAAFTEGWTEDEKRKIA